jgi:hypothetical protein
VLLVIPPHVPRPSDLVVWYESAIKDFLKEHPHALSIFTPQQAALRFLPPNKKKAGRKEVAAASLALERLTNNGVLCRHTVQGELRYVND